MLYQSVCDYKLHVAFQVWDQIRWQVDWSSSQTDGWNKNLPEHHNFGLICLINLIDNVKIWWQQWQFGNHHPMEDNRFAACKELNDLQPGRGWTLLASGGLCPLPDYYSQFILVRIIQDSCDCNGENGIIRLNVLSPIILPSIRLDLLHRGNLELSTSHIFSHSHSVEHRVEGLHAVIM